MVKGLAQEPEGRLAAKPLCPGQQAQGITINIFMSRIGKLPIQIPANVQVTLNEGSVLVKGTKGELTETIDRSMSIDLQDGVLSVKPKAEKRSAIWGLTRALVSKM